MTSHMKGKTCIITGATSGIGKSIAVALAAEGASVTIIGRNPEKTAGIVAEIKTQTGNESIIALIADLSSQRSIRELAATINKTYDRVDVLVNNAGGLYSKRTLSVDNIEMTFALDHLAYFLLTNLILNKLKSSAPARIVSTSSSANFFGKINFDNLNGEKSYRDWSAYSQAKLANVLFTYELARRLKDTNVTANCFHPGFVDSGFSHNNKGLTPLLISLAKPVTITPEKGAETGIYLASSLAVEGLSGRYFDKKTEKRSNPQSYDLAIAGKLWDVSAQMTGLASS